MKRSNYSRFENRLNLRNPPGTLIGKVAVFEPFFLVDFGPVSHANTLFRKVFSLFPVAGFVATVAVGSAVFSGNSSGLGRTAMAAIVGMIGESF